jgi:guanine deaminase
MCLYSCRPGPTVSTGAARHMASSTPMVAHRGRIAHCLADPHGRDDALEFFEDGVLLLDQGKVAALGPTDSLLANLSEDIQIINHGNNLIVPGFIDCHIHFPQIDVIASYGTQLLEWLENYTFPAEKRYADAAIAEHSAEFFLNELLRNGTTSALVFATVHPTSVNAIFTAAAKRNMRVAAGKVLMDRHCPDDLQDTAQSGYRDSRELLERWHGQDRLHYAITPRFAITSSNAQLEAAGRLAKEFPDTLIHTHLAENHDEVRWIAELFPEARSYLDVYNRHGLVRDRAVFAHCLHLEESDYVEMSSCGAGIAFCPTSNLFLGSGLFNLDRARQHHINVGLGTDVGGGTSFSLLQTMNEAYKVLQLQKQSLASAEALYLATLGAAKTLGIDNKVGNFNTGHEADFVVLDAAPTPLLAHRLPQAKSVSETLFMQMMLGDDRSIAATYIMGELAHSKTEGETARHAR